MAFSQWLSVVHHDILSGVDLPGGEQVGWIYRRTDWEDIVELGGLHGSSKSSTEKNKMRNWREGKGGWEEKETRKDSKEKVWEVLKRVRNLYIIRSLTEPTPNHLTTSNADQCIHLEFSGLGITTFNEQPKICNCLDFYSLLALFHSKYKYLVWNLRREESQVFSMATRNLHQNAEICLPPRNSWPNTPMFERKAVGWVILDDIIELCQAREEDGEQGLNLELEDKIEDLHPRKRASDITIS